jgi:hypothetical protein
VDTPTEANMLTLLVEALAPSRENAAMKPASNQNSQEHSINCLVQIALFTIYLETAQGCFKKVYQKPPQI